MALPKLNVRHINKIVKHIAGNVKRLYMPTWGVQKGSEVARERELKDSRFPECGTVACFAGWSKLLSIPKKEWKSIFTDTGAMEVIEDSDFGASIVAEETQRLGLTKGEAADLFDSAYGSPSIQFTAVKQRLRCLIAARVDLGDKSAKRIKL